jgi:hypothetical protein
MLQARMCKMFWCCAKRLHGALYPVVMCYMMGRKTVPGGNLPPAPWRSFCGCGKLIFSYSVVFMGLRETFFSYSGVFMGLRETHVFVFMGFGQV